MDYQRRGWQGILIVMVLVLAGLTVLATAWGAVSIPLGEVFAMLAQKIPLINRLLPGGEFSPVNQTIIWELRLPRVVLAGLVGMALALAGATFQGIFKNPMADPHIIGVSQGASLGACAVIVIGLRFDLGGMGAVPLAAFIGALGTVTLVYFLARTGGRVPVMTLLLAGIAVGTLLSALVSLLIFFSDQLIHSIVFWLMGGFSARDWDYVKMALPYTLIGGGVILALARELNLMLMGEETAQHLGIEVETVKKVLLLAASLLTATAVSAGGIIGFVGLIVPHAVRLMVGPDHRILLPASALAGAIFLITADILARVLLAPTELPVGIITALFGAPFFLFLLHRNRRGRLWSE